MQRRGDYCSEGPGYAKRIFRWAPDGVPGPPWRGQLLTFVPRPEADHSPPHTAENGLESGKFLRSISSANGAERPIDPPRSVPDNRTRGRFPVPDGEGRMYLIGGWFASATNIFRRQTSEPPQCYRIRCACGETLEGDRSPAHQVVTCNGCQSPLFVLPASVYPRPATPPRRKPARREVPHTGEATAVAQAAMSVAESSVKRADGQLPPDGRAARQSPRGTPGVRFRAPQALFQFDFDRWRRRTFTPLRLALAAIALVIGGTIWWRWHLQVLEKAREVLAEAPRLGEEALHEGDLSTAARQFASLRRALDVLGRDDPQARIWRQTARETEAAADLADTPLHLILREASQIVSEQSLAAWKNMFDSGLRGSWVVVDAPVSRSADADVGPRYLIDCPIYFQDEHAVLWVDLSGLEKALAPDNEPRRVIFAARLAECRPEPEVDHTWRIVLEETSGFLWAGTEVYESLGMPLDDDTRRVLDEQAHWLGVTP